ncbi:MAG: glycosyltransferase family 39 protein [Solirubrobacterales bacterium]
MVDREESDAGQPPGLVAPFLRYGTAVAVILGIIVVVGFGLRLDRVVTPDPFPGDDALAYRALAESLYEDGTYGGSDFRDPSDWSPGAPLLFAAGHFITGGVNDGAGRGIQAILGTAAILVVFLIGARLDPGPVGPLFAAGLVALYPPFIHSVGSLMSEPTAIFTLPAAVLAFLWADSAAAGGGWRIAAWILPGILFGLTCLVRPEYLFVSFVIALFLLLRQWLGSGPSRSLASTAIFIVALLVPIVPWTIHNVVTLDRVVPITTGSGKALFVGTNLPADGEYQRVKADLVERYEGLTLAPGSERLDRIDPTPLFDRVAAEYPALDRDEALGRIGRENLFRYLREQPLDYAGMLVRKGVRMWDSGVGEAMSSPPGRAVQIILVLMAVAGAVLLGRERRWEVVPLTLPIIVVSAIAVLTLAPPRRNEVLMTLVLVLVAYAVSTTWRWASRPAGPAVDLPEGASP